MELSKPQKIGTHFEKDKIFLATLTLPPELSNEKYNVPKNQQEFFSALSKINCTFSLQEFDIFYKGTNGYTRFFEAGPDTIIGDNSDKKGTLSNIETIWNYYSEEQIYECYLNHHWMICTLDVFPLKKYNEKYNRA